MKFWSTSFLVILVVGCTDLKPGNDRFDAETYDGSSDDGSAPDAELLDAGSTSDVDTGTGDAGIEVVDAGTVDMGMADAGMSCAAYMPYTWTVQTRANAALSSDSPACVFTPMTRTARATSAEELFTPCGSTCTCSTVIGPCSVRRTMVCASSTVTEEYTFGASPNAFTGRKTYVAGVVTCVADVTGTWVSP